MHLMLSFPPARVRDAGRHDAAQRRQQPLDDVRVWAQRGSHSTGEALTTGERVGTLLTMGARAYSLGHVVTPHLATVPHIQSDYEASQIADSRSLCAWLRDDEPMVLPNGPDEDLPG